MKHYFLRSIVAIVLVLPLSSSFAENFRFTDIRTPFKYFFTVSRNDDNSLYAKGTDSVERFSVGDQVFYREVTHWYYEQSKKHKYEDAVMVKRNEKIYASYLLRLVTNAEGKVIREEENIFNIDARTCRVIRKYDDPTKEEDWGLTDNIDSMVTDLPEDTYTKPMLNMCLRSVSMKEGGKFDCHLITQVGMLFKNFYEVKERTQVTVPAGEFDCFLVVQHPQASIGFIKFPSRLSPKQEFWYTAEEPHQLIKYVGYEEAPANRTQLGPVLAGKVTIQVDVIKPMGIDDLEDKTKLLERMRARGLLE